MLARKKFGASTKSSRFFNFVECIRSPRRFFFSQIDRRWPVVVGQYLGFSALIAIGLVEFSSGCVCRTSIAKIAIITGGRSLRATSPIHLS
ncbi:MAG: hypothetical protein DME86_12660 [Verrucomicrobia bacterium]|nr:MAG: hypothetical protein DME86_12660 [Verrucomicrobiota bacterium]